MPITAIVGTVALHADRAVTANCKQQRAVVIGAVDAAAERAVAVEHVVFRVPEAVAVAGGNERDVGIDPGDKFRLRRRAAAVMRHQQHLRAQPVGQCNQHFTLGFLFDVSS